jgi:hypothetical protein
MKPLLLLPLAAGLLWFLLKPVAELHAPHRMQAEPIRGNLVRTEEFVFRYSRTLPTDSGLLVFDYHPLSDVTVRTRYAGDSVVAADVFVFRAEDVNGVLEFHTYRVRRPTGGGE